MQIVSQLGESRKDRESLVMNTFLQRQILSAASDPITECVPFLRSQV